MNYKNIGNTLKKKKQRNGHVLLDERRYCDDGNSSAHLTASFRCAYIQVLHIVIRSIQKLR